MLVESRINGGLHRLVCQARNAANLPLSGSTVEVA